MSLGSTQYAAVSWTNGDTITEAKLDNMVANDQAYDSHAAEGLLLNNNTGYYQKDSGGTNREILNIDASDDLQIGDENLGSVYIASGGDTYMTLQRRDYATTSHEAKTTVLHGWTYIEGDDANSTLDITVTFDKTFAEAPVVVSSYLGSKATPAPTAISQITNSQFGTTQFAADASSITTTGCTIEIQRTAGNFASGAFYGASYIAVGRIA